MKNNNVTYYIGQTSKGVVVSTDKETFVKYKPLTIAQSEKELIDIFNGYFYGYILPLETEGLDKGLESKLKHILYSVNRRTKQDNITMHIGEERRKKPPVLRTSINE
ncbi:MAG: hypothetical protein KAU20_04955 [Nanoarchaeota archaeon]|nr:hypothetical protein [Nanoarchaeota archaeon]